MRRQARAVWDGGLSEGRGRMSTQSGALTEAAYAFSTRFGQEPGTNPEELVAAAHAGCYCMALAFWLERAGWRPERLEVQAELAVAADGGGWTARGAHLRLRARVPGLGEADFQRLAAEAEAGCLVSRMLRLEITLEARLEG